MGTDLWFKRKKYGWGWTPANYKGWLVTILFILSNSIYPALFMVHVIEFSLPAFFGTIGVSISILIFICYKKGEKPKWQWGDKE